MTDCNEQIQFKPEWSIIGKANHRRSELWQKLKDTKCVSFLRLLGRQSSGEVLELTVLDELLVVIEVGYNQKHATLRIIQSLFIVTVIYLYVILERGQYKGAADAETSSKFMSTHWQGVCPDGNIFQDCADRSHWRLHVKPVLRNYPHSFKRSDGTQERFVAFFLQRARPIFSLNECGQQDERTRCDGEHSTEKGLIFRHPTEHHEIAPPAYEAVEPKYSPSSSDVPLHDERQQDAPSHHSGHSKPVLPSPHVKIPQRGNEAQRVDSVKEAA
jgi:hypothetical protein